MRGERFTRDPEGERIIEEVRARLFGGAPLPVGIGRYRVISRLGHGAMGVVYEAHDGRLDRKVALKLLATSSDATTRARAIREAQALARLTHPNVVSVYDVHVEDADISIAMEFVAGQTLEAWAASRPRHWREVRRVMLDVARGVAAAHAKGMVHQDLKPSNVMVELGGRARVLDFGLARIFAVDPDSTTQHREHRAPGRSSVGGTPDYMAPEQLRGAAVGPAADQFGWSVMFWELLFGELPFKDEDAVRAGRRRPPPPSSRVPRWLRAIAERGLAVEPCARYPDMHALITALETDPRVRYTIRAGLVGLAVGVSTWAILARVDHEASIRGCEREGAVVGESWGDAARARLRRDVLGTGAPFAASTLDRIVPMLDGYAGTWQDARVRLCTAEAVDGTMKAEQAAPMLACLDEARQHLDSLLAILAEARPDRIGWNTIENAIGAVGTLPQLSACEDPLRLRVRPAPPDGLAAEVSRIRGILVEASALGMTGMAIEGLTRAESAQEAAMSLGWAPLKLEADLRRGLQLATLGRYAEAHAALKDTYIESGKIHQDDIALDAAIALVHTAINQGEHDESSDWVRMAGMHLARHDVANDDPRRALLYRNLGFLRMTEGKHREAIAMHRRALDIEQRVYGHDHPDVADDLSNLADCHRLAGDMDEAVELGARALELAEKALGPDHPGIVDVLGTLGVIQGDAGQYARALATLERVLAIHEETLPADHVLIGVTLSNIGATHHRMGSQELALAALERAQPILERALGPGHSEVATSHFTIGLVQGSRGLPGPALVSLNRARSILARELDPEHPKLAALHLALCHTHGALGEWTAAVDACWRAFTVYERLMGVDDQPYLLALARLGITLVEVNELAQARRHLEPALAICSRRADDPGLLGELQFALARCLWPLPDARARAVGLVREAVNNLAAAGPEYAVDLARARDWLTAVSGAAR